MANHTRCYHAKPSFAEVESAVALQFTSGEGAIQFVPEAVARANADVLNTFTYKSSFLKDYEERGRLAAKEYLAALAAEMGIGMDERELAHRDDEAIGKPLSLSERLRFTSDVAAVPPMVQGSSARCIRSYG